MIHSLPKEENITVVFFTTKTYPPTKADHFYVLDFSKSMSQIKGVNYYLVINKKTSFDFNRIKIIELNLKEKKFFGGIFFQLIYKIPILMYKFHTKKQKTFFITNDKNIGILLGIWNKILLFKHVIVADWHHKSNQYKDLLFLNSCDKHIFISHGMKEYVTQTLKKNKKSEWFVSPMAVNPQTFDINLSKNDARNELHLALDKKIYGYFGRFTTFGKEKGIQICLESLKNLPDDYIFVGAGGIDEDIIIYKKIAKNFGVDNRAFLFGTQPQEKLAIYQKACDVLVAPYPDTPHYANDMSPMKLFEYMVAKRPIVASRLPAITSIINEGILYFNPDDKLDFVDKIINANSLDENSDRIINLYNKGLNNSWNSKAKQVVSFLREK